MFLVIILYTLKNRLRLFSREVIGSESCFEKCSDNGLQAGLVRARALESALKRRKRERLE